jgi:hypothetical protein
MSMGDLTGVMCMAYLTGVMCMAYLTGADNIIKKNDGRDEAAAA